MKQTRLWLSIALAGLLSMSLYVLATPAATVHAEPNAHHALVFRSFGPAAMASFVGGYTFDGQHILVEVSVSIAQATQAPPGKPSTPMEGVSIIEHNEATGDQLNGAGQIPLPVGTTIDGKHLTAAHLPASKVKIAPTLDNPDAFTPYFAQVGAVDWTGVGDITSTALTIHTRIPHVVSSMVHMTGASRSATAVIGSVSYTSPLTGEQVTLTNLINMPGPSAGLPTELSNGRTTAVFVFHDSSPS